MRATNLPQNIEGKICVSRRELPKLLGCGQHTADFISQEAGAKIKIGKRVLILLPKVEEYLKEKANES